MRNPLILTALLASVCATPLHATMQVKADSAATHLESERRLGETELRGYGKVSGHYYQFNQGSILEILCVSPEKAKLTQAKYLSDAQLLPGVKPAQGTIPGSLEATGQGDIAAVRDGSNVFILDAPSATALTSLAENALSGGSGQLDSTPQAQIPMWLDKWDKYGFRMTDYDIARMYMPEKSDRNSFDFFKPFEWMKSVGLGFAVDPFMAHEDFSEGMISEPFYQWTENAARDLSLPFSQRSMAPTEDATPAWFANRYIDEMQQHVPFYTGAYYSQVPDPGWGNNSRTLSWSGTNALDEYLSIVQQGIRDVASYPNLINYNYPLQEVAHGAHDIFTEYGPVADQGYRVFLKGRYGTLTVISKRWYGDECRLKQWSDVHVPEPAEFEGWSADALNIAGNWKVKRMTATDSPPADWNKPECADSNWETVKTPGDSMMFGGYHSPGSPAVFRIHFDIPVKWLNGHPHRWLYVWDLSPWNTEMSLSLNGAEPLTDKGWPYVPHWVPVDVSGQLKPGSNELALLLPNGFIGYRVYLSGEAPKIYPFLGKQMNARWADYMDWRTASRIQAIRRAVDAIRQIDPNRPIALDAPHYILDEARELASEAGGMLHDTGGLAGSWNIYEPMLVEGAGQPYSVEGGIGARTIEEYQMFLGRYVTEGIQSVEDVTPDASSLYYKPDLRKYVEDTMPISSIIGKYHVPPAQVAYLMSNREIQMLEYPWRPDGTKVLSMGYQGWYTALEYPAVGLMESDFLKDRAGKYAVVIDTNTQVMDEKVVDGIERYVRNGGVFVTLGQTGRHTEIAADSWPISRLTGYKVTGMDPHDVGGFERPRACGLGDPLPGNGIFQIKSWSENPAFLSNVKYANGLSLKKQAADCRDLIKWNDGATAVGIRPMGKGYVIDMGVVFGKMGSSFLMKKLLEDIILWRGVKDRTPAQIYPPIIADPASFPKDLGIVPGSVYLLSAVGEACQKQYDHDFDGFPWSYKHVIFRHYVTNNGLYDVWALFNQSETDPRTVDLTFRDGLNPAFGYDVEGGRQIAVTRTGGLAQVRSIALQPRETRIFLTPRRDFRPVALDWFELQRDWWRSNYEPGKSFPPVPHRFSVDLNSNWAFMPVDGKSDDNIAALADPKIDDTKWEHRPLGIWTIPSRQNVRHGLLRHWIEIPANWDKGTVRFWLISWYLRSFYDHGWLYIDGRKFPETADYLGQDMTGAFLPGSRHLIAIEVKSDGQMTGVAGDCWVYYTPEPNARTTLAGEWLTSKDMLHFGGNAFLPGEFSTPTIRRTGVILDPAQKGKNVILFVDSDKLVHGAIVNGHWVSRHHHCIGPFLELNITPWVKFNAANQIELTEFRNDRPEARTRTVELRYYNPGQYP